jgi:hypothetical protein
MPYHLLTHVPCSDVQKRVINAATECCNGLGLHNGVFNAEFKLTSAGLKLIKVNGRQGGFYVQVRTFNSVCH